MKLVREHIILEKFIEDSDPIHDLGIGVLAQIKDWLSKKTHTGYAVGEKDYQTMFKLLVFNDKLDFADFLLKFKSNEINIDHNECSLLRWAGWQKKYKEGLFLLERGADIERALSHAKKHNETETTQGLSKLKKMIEKKKYEVS